MAVGRVASKALAFSRSAVEAFRAPSLGEHGHQIAVGLCGLTPARLTELELLGVFK
jgi:hypothetical protein